MVNKHVKRCPASLTNQIARCHLPPPLPPAWPPAKSGRRPELARTWKSWALRAPAAGVTCDAVRRLLRKLTPPGTHRSCFWVRAHRTASRRSRTHAHTHAHGGAIHDGRNVEATPCPQQAGEETSKVWAAHTVGQEVGGGAEARGGGGGGGVEYLMGTRSQLHKTERAAEMAGHTPYVNVCDTT